MKEKDPGFGIYVHWPFCEAKCPYCDFNSHVRHGGVRQSDYVDAYKREIAAFAALAPEQPVTSIFFGGGTPSLMAPETLDAILNEIQNAWPMAANVEISMEANPSSAEASRFAAYRASGVNRLSIGVQSLNAEDLKFLGRLHTVDQALEAIEMGRALFPRLSFDLIYARPNQTLQAWEEELTRAIYYAADHLSLYQLTIEADTPFQKLFDAGKLTPPDADFAGELFELTQSLCNKHGLFSYEISNHAKKGFECRHNLTYWRYGDYAGIGPGAHSRLTIENERTALASEPFPETWMARVNENGNGIWNVDVLTHEAASDEMLLMGLRLKEGISLSRYEALAQRRMKPERIQALLEQNILEQPEKDIIRASATGRLVLDHLIADLAT